MCLLALSHSILLQHQARGNEMEAQYKQAIRDVIYQAVEREIAIWEAQVKVEAILRAEWGVEA